MDVWDSPNTERQALKEGFLSGLGTPDPDSDCGEQHTIFSVRVPLFSRLYPAHPLFRSSKDTISHL